MLYGVAIALLYYGLLRANEVQELQVKDVVMSNAMGKKEIVVLFNHECKKRNEGFKYYIPNVFYPMFHQFMGEVCPRAVSSGKV